MATLYNTRISDTYVGLIKTIDNAAISATLRELTDGSGNGTGLSLNNAGDFKVNAILEFGSLKDTGENIVISKFVDAADGIGNNNNDTSIPTTKAIIDYVAGQITAEDLDFRGDDSAVLGDVDLNSQAFIILGTANEIETSVTSAGGNTLQIGIPSNPVLTGIVTATTFSGNLTGNVTGNVTGDLTGNVTATSVLANGVTATTQASSDNSTKVATTAYVKGLDNASDLDFKGDNGTAGDVNLNTQRFDILGTTNQITTVSSGQSLTIGMPTNITISGIVNATTFNGDLNGTINTATTAVTQSAGDNSTKVATTAYVDTLDAASDLDITDGSNTGDVNLNTQSLSILGTSQQVTSTVSNQSVTLSLPSSINVNSASATILQNARDISLTGEASATISSFNGSANVSGAVTLDNDSVTGKVLTGLASPTATNILASDSILQAFGKTQSQLNTLAGGLRFMGTWNATTNSPTLASGGGESASGTTTGTTANKLVDSSGSFTSAVDGDKVVNQASGATATVTNVDSSTVLSLSADIMVSGQEYTIDNSPYITQGHYYVVSVGGTSSLNGLSNWAVGDWVIAGAGNVWEKLDHTQVDGTGTVGNITKWSSTNVIADSIMAESGSTITATGSIAATQLLSSGGNFAVNTDKFTVNATTGNVAVAGTLDVTSTGIFNDNVSIIKGSAVNLRVTDGTQNIYVGSSSNARFGLGAGASIIQSTGAAFGIGTQDSQALRFGTNNTEVLTLDTSSNATFAGSVGVAGSSIVEKFNTPNIKISGSTITGTVSANTLLIDNLSSISRFFSCGADSSTNGTFNFNTGTSTGLGATMLTLASTGATFAENVGIGITPSASFSGVEVLQLGKGMTIFGNTNDDRATMASNLILNTGTAFEYVMDGLAGKFSIEDGNMSFGTAPSGTAGSVATITERFAIANTGAATFAGTVSASRGFFNAGATNVVATFTSTDATSTLQCIDGVGNVEFGASGDSFVVQPAGGVAQLTVGASSSTFTGNVGIGVTGTPASKFEVYGGNSGVNDVDRYIRFKASNGEKRFDFYVGGTGNAPSLGMYTSDGTTKNVQISGGGTSYFNGGDVGIGITSPNVRLGLSNSTALTAVYQQFTNGTTGTTASDGTVMGIDSDGDFLINNQEAKEIKLYTSDSLRLTIDSSGAITTDVTGEVDIPFYVDGYKTGVQQIWLNNSRAANSSNGRGTKLVLGAGNTIGAYFTHYTSGSTGNGVLDIGVQYTGVTTQSGLEFNTNSNRTIIKSVGSSAAYTAFESSDGTERMRITSAGNVGIGVIPNAPSNGLIQLDVGDNGCGMTSRQNNELVIQANANYGTYAQTGVPATRLNLTNNGEFHFLNAPAGAAVGDTITFIERMRIDSNGSIGMGANSSSYRLRIKTDATVTNGVYISAGTGNGNHSLYVEDKDGTAEYFAVRGDGQIRLNASRVGDTLFGCTALPSASVFGSAFKSDSKNRYTLMQSCNSTALSDLQEFFNPNGAVGKIQTSGSATLFTTSSDYRLKEDLQDFNGLDKVSKIPVYDFKWKTDDSRSYGVMAHELQEVLPQAVGGEKDAEEMQSVDYSKIVPVLVKAIQELKAEVDLLKQECKCK